MASTAEPSTVRGRPEGERSLERQLLGQVLRTHTCDELGERSVVGREFDPLVRGDRRLGRAHSGQVLESTHVALQVADATDHVDGGAVGEGSLPGEDRLACPRPARRRRSRRGSPSTGSTTMRSGPTTSRWWRRPPGRASTRSAWTPQPARGADDQRPRPARNAGQHDPGQHGAGHLPSLVHRTSPVLPAPAGGCVSFARAGWVAPSRARPRVPRRSRRGSDRSPAVAGLRQEGPRATNTRSL